MSTPTTSGLNNESATLKNNSIGSPADGVKPTASNPTTSAMGVGSQVGPIVVKYVDGNEFDGARGGDTRCQAAPADPLKGNDLPVRGETGSQGA